MDQILAKYDVALRTRPVRTKATVGFCLSALGNILGQYRAAPNEAIDVKLAFLFAIRGSPPWSHWWFNWLDNAFPGLPVLARLCLDQLLWRPLLVLYSFVAMGLLEGKSLAAIGDTLKNRFQPTVIASLRFGFVTQTVNFKLVPLRWRTTFWEFASLFWNIYLTLQLRRAHQLKHAKSIDDVTNEKELEEAEKVEMMHARTRRSSDGSSQRRGSIALLYEMVTMRGA